jgi:two-component system, NtrC family, sensor kinase
MRAQADDSRAELELKLAALEADSAALRARQSATSRMWQEIARGPTEVTQALDMIAESASALCGAYDAVVLLRQGDHLVRGAHHGPIPMNIERFPISPGSTAGRCVLERRVTHVHDLRTAGHEFPDAAEMALRFGHRSIVSVPLLRGEEAIAR